MSVEARCLDRVVVARPVEAGPCADFKQRKPERLLAKSSETIQHASERRPLARSATAVKSLARFYRPLDRCLFRFVAFRRRTGAHFEMFRSLYRPRWPAIACVTSSTGRIPSIDFSMPFEA